MKRELVLLDQLLFVCATSRVDMHIGRSSVTRAVRRAARRHSLDSSSSSSSLFYYLLLSSRLRGPMTELSFCTDGVIGKDPRLNHR